MTTNIQRFDDYTLILFFSFPIINLEWGDDVPVQGREHLRLKKHLQRNLWDLHLH